MLLVNYRRVSVLLFAVTALVVNGCGDDSTPAPSEAEAGSSGRAGAAGRSGESSGASGAGGRSAAGGGAGEAGDHASGGTISDAGEGGQGEAGASGEAGAGAAGESGAGGTSTGSGGSGGGGAGGAGGNSGSAGSGGTSGSSSGSAGTSGSGGSSGAPSCEPSEAHVCPGETKTFASVVTVSLAANASGPVGVVVNPPTVTVPSGYAKLPGTPVVQLVGSSTTLPGRTTVSISGVTVGADPIALLDVERSTVAVGHELGSSTLSFNTWRDGTFLIASSQPLVPCAISTRAGGTFDATNISALEGVTHLTTGLAITGVAPSNLSALSCLVEVNGTLSISNASNLTSLQGLGALAVIRGNLDIQSNSHLANADALGGITTITGRVYVVSNPQLASLDGLRSLTSLGSSLTVDSNALLLSFRANQLQHLKAGFAYSSNSGSASQPSAFDLGAVTLIQGGLSINSNKTWRLGTGLASLQQLEGNFDVQSNTQLDYLRDLEQLQSISGRIYVVGNPALLTLDGFSSLDTLGGSLTVSSNAALPNCWATWLRDSLQGRGWAGSSSISGNGSGTCPL